MEIPGRLWHRYNAGFWSFNTFVCWRCSNISTYISVTVFRVNIRWEDRPVHNFHNAGTCKECDSCCFIVGIFVTVRKRNILHEIRKRKASWIGHILRRNCLPQRVIEGKVKGDIEVTGRRGRKRRKLLDDVKERRGYSHLKEEALDRTMWRARFGRGFGPVVRQTTKWM